MRIGLSSLVFTLALIPTNLYANNSVTEKDKARDGISLDRYKKITGIQSRKIDVTPQAGTEGIKTGVVMVYGHIIPPPYRIESNDNRLLVNGVQVVPSLIKERNRRNRPSKKAPADKASKQKKAGGILNSARALYESEKVNSTSAIAQKKVLDFLSKHPDAIQDPVWRAEELCYKTPAHSFSQCINLGQSRQINEARWEKNASDARAQEISTIQSELRNGRWVCFGSTGGWVARNDLRSEVRTVMEASDLSEQQKAEALKERVFHNYGLALDVLENYVASEWAAEN